MAHVGGRGERGREHPPGRAQLPLGGVDHPDDALGDPDRGVRFDQLAAELQRLRPLPALAQHIDHAGHAGDLGARLIRGAAELEGAVERLLGAAVVGRVVEHDAQSLVELGRDRREVVLEGEREAGAHGLQSLLVLAPLGLRHSLEPERASPQVEPLRPLGVLHGRLRQLDRLAVPAPRIEGSWPWRAARRPPRRAFQPPRNPRRPRHGRRAPDRARPSCRARRRACSAAAAYASPPPGSVWRTAQISRQARAASASSPHSSALLRIRAARPRLALPRPRPRARARAPGVPPERRRGMRAPHATPPPRAAARHEPRPRAGAEPVGGHLDALGAGRLQRLGQPAVEGSPLEPGHVGVERLARQSVAERGTAAVALDDDPAPEQLCHAVGAGDLHQEIEIELLAGDAPRPRRRVYPPARARRRRSARRRGRCPAAAPRRPSQARARCRPCVSELVTRSARASSSTKNEHALGAIVDRR